MAWTKAGEVTSYQEYNHYKLLLLSMHSLCQYNTIHNYYELEIIPRTSKTLRQLVASAMNDAQRWTGNHNSVAIISPLPSTTIIILCNIVICKEPCRAGGSNFHVVRPNLVSALCWVVACVSTLKLGGAGGMLSRENVEICSLRDGF